MVTSSEAVPELLPIFEATAAETGARERSGTRQQLQPAKQHTGGTAGVALPSHLSNKHAATTNLATVAEAKHLDSSGGSSCMASTGTIDTVLNAPAGPGQLDSTQSALEALISRSAAVTASSQLDSSMLAGNSPADISHQQLAIVPISQAASNLAEATVPAALAGSLSALPAPPQTAETAAGTQDLAAAAAAAQGLIGLTDNTTINAIFLQNGLNLQGNFASTAALSGLLSDMSQAQLASLTQVSAAGGATDLANIAGFGSLGYGVLGQNPVAAAAAAAAAAADDDDGKSAAQAGNKQLSSRYRGVCWNKKNKRWQAAINSGGKYIYLGSFTSEDDAAKQFDRAAIKIRGKKAKLNFCYSDYVDSEGNLLEDLPLPSGTASKDDRSARNSTGGKSGPGNNFDGDCIYFETQPGDAASQAFLSGMQAGAAGVNGGLGTAWGGLNGVGLTGLSGAKIVRTPVVLNLNDVPGVLPEGCSLESVISGSDGYMSGVLYKTETGQPGCGLWTGYKFYTYGEYQNEADARQMLTKSMDMLSDDRQVRAVPIPAAAAAAAAGTAGVPAVVGGKADGQLFGQANMAQSQTVGQTIGQSDAFMAALGLGGLRPAGVVGGGFFTPVSAAGVGDSSRVVSTMGNMANYDFAKAQQLVREAVEQQQQQQQQQLGVSVGISFPPLTVDLPIGSQAAEQQQQQGDIHFVLQRYLQQGEPKQQQQQQQPTAAEQVAQLSVFDVATLHQLIKQQGDVPQQQQQQQPAAVSGKPIGGNISSISVEELLASIGAKPPAAATTIGVSSSTAATPAAASSAPYWSNLLALTTATTQPATTPAAAVDVSAAVQGTSAAAAAAAEEPAAKRLKVSDQGPPAAAAAGGGEGGDAAAEAGLQEAVKQIMALSNGTAS